MREDKNYKALEADIAQYGPLTKVRFVHRGQIYEMIIDEEQLYKLKRPANRTIFHIKVEDYAD